MSDSYFTPIFIITAICLGIGGVIVINFIDSIYMDNPYRRIIQLFCLCITLNIIILVFLIMSFSKVKYSVGPKGPSGIKGSYGYIGQDGNLENCGNAKISVFDKRHIDHINNDLDLKPPTIIN